MDNLDKIYREVAKEMGISATQVKQVASTQFLLLRDSMKEKRLKDVRMQYLGVFKVKPYRLRYLSQEAKELIKQWTNEFDKFF